MSESFRSLPFRERASLHRRKFWILFFGTILGFFTSMSKVIVPGPVFNQLQAELGFSAGGIALIGAFFMYAYAVSQLAVGVFSNRYGGVRLLLIGGSLFCLGHIVFPFLSSLPLMCAARTVSALGAGTVFLGNAKLISDLYPRKFGFVLGCVLFIGYIGPASGIFLIAWLVQHIPWRSALFLFACCSLLCMVVIGYLSRGTVKPVVPGNSFHKIFFIFKNGKLWLLCIASSFVFGSYYALLLFAGQKCLEDFAHFSPSSASFWITVCALVVAGNNILVHLVLKWIGSSRLKYVLPFSSCCSLAGGILGVCAIHFSLPSVLLIPAVLLIAVPAGFFSIFCSIAKEMMPREYIGLAVSLVNFWAFVAIAAVSHAAGLIMNHFEKYARKAENSLVYPPEAYGGIFLLIFLLAVIGLLCSLPVSLSKNGKRTVSD